MLDVFAKKMRAVECRDTTPVEFAYFKRVWEGILSTRAALKKVAAILAGRRDFKPVVIACKTRESLEHFIGDRFSFVNDHGHLSAGFVERMPTFGFAGVICHEAFDLATGIVACDKKLYDLKYLTAIRDIDLFADILYVLIRLIFKLLVRR